MRDNVCEIFQYHVLRMFFGKNLTGNDLLPIMKGTKFKR